MSSPDHSLTLGEFDRLPEDGYELQGGVLQTTP